MKGTRKEGRKKDNLYRYRERQEALREQARAKGIEIVSIEQVNYGLAKRPFACLIESYKVKNS